VTHIALAIGDTMGLAAEERYTLELAARLHDIGKISLPDSALNKPGRLSDEEWAAMQRHPSVGSRGFGYVRGLEEGHDATVRDGFVLATLGHGASIHERCRW
jgi:HD-GYP domain-containing protein (c-di-GMP phosphodiesterase class II)